jgi:MerC mercury resistance protein
VKHEHDIKIRRRDAVGMLVSLLCLVHCLVAPLLIAAVPALGIGFLAMDGIHFAFALAVLLAAVVALIPGYRHHHRVSVLVLGAAGVFAVTVGATLPEGLPETGVTSIGSALMIAAHVTNLRHGRLHLHPPRLAASDN